MKTKFKDGCNQELYKSVMMFRQYNTYKLTDCEWSGYLRSMAEDIISKMIFNYVPIGKKNKGRLRTRWLDQVGGEFMTLGVSNWWTLEEDGDEWRKCF